MATGIVATGASVEGMAWAPAALAGIAAALWLALAAWALRTGAARAGLSERIRRFGFVAATGVLISSNSGTSTGPP